MEAQSKKNQKQLWLNVKNSRTYFKIKKLENEKGEECSTRDEVNSIVEEHFCKMYNPAFFRSNQILYFIDV